MPVAYLGASKIGSAFMGRREKIDFGTVFGDLTVLDDKGKNAFCRCSCGNELEILVKGLKSGNNKSCGCRSANQQKLRSLRITPTGTVFGRLTVIENHYGTCLCRCACGNQKEISTGALRNSSIQSCGCLRIDELKKRTEKPIAAGAVFGHLTVLEYHGKRCKCACWCGSEVVISSTHLRTGHTKSCGCLQREIAGRKQIKKIGENNRFGKLTILEQMRGSGNGTVCLCRCDCGNQVKVASNKLLYGHTKSCGCLREDPWYNQPLLSSNWRNSYSAYVVGAEKREVIFSLSRAEFRALLIGNCAYCGAPHDEVKIGIDRRNNLNGYTLENSVSCCTICNRAKYQFSVDDFLCHLLRISQYQLAPKNDYRTVEVGTASAAAIALFKHYRGLARARRKAFLLEEKDIARFIKSNCHYCGCGPAAIFAGKYAYNGIDRIDNSMGYSLDNCVPSCKFCNRAKGTQSAYEFYKWVERVVKHRQLIAV